MKFDKYVLFCTYRNWTAAPAHVCLAGARGLFGVYWLFPSYALDFPAEISWPILYDSMNYYSLWISWPI